MTFADFCKGKDLKEMAEAVQCHPSTLYNYKKGKSIPSDLLIRIADHYKVTTDRVLGHLVPKELVNDQAYPARPPVIHTVTTEQQDLAQLNKELAFKYDALQKELASEKLKTQLLREENGSICTRNNKLIEDLQTVISNRNKENNELTLKLQAKTTGVCTQQANPKPNDFPELLRLKALMQSIHFLSEEK